MNLGAFARMNNAGVGGFGRLRDYPVWKASLDDLARTDFLFGYGMQSISSDATGGAGAHTAVFKHPVEIMANIERVTSYLREHYPNQLTLHFHHTADGANYYVAGADHNSDSGYFWRVSNYIDSITFDNTDDLAVIAATGEAFGHFQMQLSGFDGSVLFETIPDFHNNLK